MNEFYDGVEIVHIDEEQKNMIIRLDNIREFHNKYCEQKERIEKAIPLLCEADSLIMKKKYGEANLRILEAKKILKGSDK